MTPRLTLFTSPRSFAEARFATLQRNAIGSWLALRPAPEIILFGADAGVADFARRHGLAHVPEVECDPRGVPMRSAMCALAARLADTELLCGINADIILLDGLAEAVARLAPAADARLRRGFVAAGRRHNLNVTAALDFTAADWRSPLRERVHLEGERFIASAIDYYVFPRWATPSAELSLPMDAPGWDPWFLHQFQRRGMPVIDLSAMVSVVHQNHETAADLERKRRIWARHPQATARLREAGGFSAMTTLREADLLLTEAGLAPPPWGQRALARLRRHKAMRQALGAKRALQAARRRRQPG